jgi:hypothetical protein
VPWTFPRLSLIANMPLLAVDIFPQNVAKLVFECLIGHFSSTVSMN